MAVWLHSVINASFGTCTCVSVCVHVAYPHRGRKMQTVNTRDISSEGEETITFKGNVDYVCRKESTVIITQGVKEHTIIMTIDVVTNETLDTKWYQ